MIFQKIRLKAETLASGMSSVVGLGSEHLHLNGVPKIFFNVVLGSVIGDKVKESYSKSIEQRDKESK